ncbi:MAG TPA: hypothetical protein VGI10_01670 [Polyangiaceae bacterium]|jgi:hypothetical protein
MTDLRLLVFAALIAIPIGYSCARAQAATDPNAAPEEPTQISGGASGSGGAAGSSGIGGSSGGGSAGVSGVGIH